MKKFLITALLLSKIIAFSSLTPLSIFSYTLHSFADNYSQGYILRYPSLIRTEAFSSSSMNSFAFEIATIPIGDGEYRWMETLCLTASENQPCATYRDTFYFYFKLEATFFKILEMICQETVPRLRLHRPTIFLEWPTKIIISAKEYKYHGLNQIHKILRNILLEQVAPISRKSIEINQNVYFVFEIVSENVIKTVWELYFINGLDDSKGKIVAQEVSSIFWETERVVRRGDLRMVTLTMVAPNKGDTQVELTWEENSQGIRTLVGGIAYEILDDLKEVLNFQTTIVEGDWITQHMNGTLKGITADLLRRREVDLVIGQTVPIPMRAEIMDYIQSTSKNKLRAYVHQPPASSFRDIYTTPFRPSLWLAMMCSLSLVFISLRIILKVIGNQNPPGFDSTDRLMISDAFIWLVGSATQQGWVSSPQSYSLRGVFITASLTTLVCYTAFAAKIVSILSVENVPIQSLNDLLKSSLPIYAVTESITITQFLTGVKAHVGTDFHIVPKSVGVNLLFHYPGSIFTYSHRFHEERLSQGYPDYLACKIIYSYPASKFPMSSAMAMQKNAPLKEYFDHKILEMRERGFLSRYRTKRIYGSGLECTGEETVYRADLGIQDILTPIILLLTGYTVCVIFFIFERFISFRKKKQIIQMFLLLYR